VTYSKRFDYFLSSLLTEQRVRLVLQRGENPECYLTVMTPEYVDDIADLREALALLDEKMEQSK